MPKTLGGQEPSLHHHLPTFATMGTRSAYRNAAVAVKPAGMSLGFTPISGFRTLIQVFVPKSRARAENKMKLLVKNPKLVSEPDVLDLQKSTCTVVGSQGQRITHIGSTP